MPGISGDLPGLATALSIIITAVLSVFAFRRSGKAADAAQQREQALLTDQVQKRYEEERADLIRQIRATYEREIEWLRARVRELQDELRDLRQSLNRSGGDS